MAPLNNQDRIFGLDLMRAVAILLVLFGHCAWIFPNGTGTFAGLMAMAAFFGVEIFFVLSGFLIGRIIYRQFMQSNFRMRQVVHFLKRRWYRTLPNYFLILIVNIGIAMYIGYALDGLWKYFLFLQNFATPLLPFFTESWSLSIEEFAYIVLPISLFIVFSIFRPKNKRRLFLTVILLLIAAFILTKIWYNSSTSNTTLGQWNVGLKSVVLYRLDSIFIGVLCGWLYANYQKQWKKLQMPCAFLGMVMIGFYMFGVGRLQLVIETHPFFWNVLYLPLASVTVAFFLPVLSEWKSEKTFLRKPITFISLISYSIYLLHYGVVLQLLKQFVNTEHLPFPIAIGFTILYFSITIFLSYLLYRFYEKPMMDKRDNLQNT